MDIITSFPIFIFEGNFCSAIKVDSIAQTFNELSNFLSCLFASSQRNKMIYDLTHQQILHMKYKLGFWKI